MDMLTNENSFCNQSPNSTKSKNVSVVQGPARNEVYDDPPTVIMKWRSLQDNKLRLRNSNRKKEL